MLPARAAVLDAPGRTLPLRLTRVVHKEITERPHPVDDPMLHRYYADLAALHGVRFRPEVLTEGAPFGVLADAVLAGLVPPEHPVDLVVIGHALPDLDPRLSAAVHLSRTLSGAPRAFAISGPGASIGFTALSLSGAYARRHGYRRVLVLVLGQTTLPYETTVERGPDTAVALLLEDAPGDDVTLGQLRGVAADDVEATIESLARGATVVRAERADASGTGLWARLSRTSDSLLVDHTHGELRYCVIRRS